MERYQVNYKLLAGLLGGAVVVGGALYGILRVQSYRGATKLLTQADQHRAEGDLRSAAEDLYRYTRKRPDDEEHAFVMASTYADVADQEDAEIVDVRNALSIMETTVRRFMDNAELRRRLVDMQIKYGLVKEARDHLQILINKSPNDPELLSLLGSCMLSLQEEQKVLLQNGPLVGYDASRNKFDEDESKVVTPHEVPIYAQLATALVRLNQDPAKAKAVLDKCVERNADDAEAYLARARLLLARGEEGKAEAIADLDKALEVDPKNINALLTRARLHALDEEYGEAKVLLEQGLADDPDSGALYLTGAFVAAQEGGNEAALDWYEKGIKQTTGSDQIALKVAKTRALINDQQLAAAKQLIDELAKLPNFQKQMLDYLKARVMVSEEQWYAAAQALETLRGVMADNTEIAEELNGMLTLCYTRLEQWERAADAAGSVLQINPRNQLAKDLRANALRNMGKGPEVTGPDTSINDIVTAELSKPADQRDWSGAIREANRYGDKLIEEKRLTPAGKKLLVAEIYMRADDFKKATSLIREAIEQEPENINTWRLACRLTAIDPDGGAVKALKMLDAVDERFKDQPQHQAVLRLDRADLYMRLKDEDVYSRMLSVADGIEEWPVSQQVMVWQGLATRFEAMRAPDQLTIARDKIASLAPNELPNLMDIFMAARSAGDDARMADAQAKILAVVGDKDNATWQFTEANRLISQYQRGLEEPTALDEADRLIQKARQKRPDWHMLYLLLADLSVERNNPQAALENLDKAATLGPPTPRSLLMHVSLLGQSGRFDDARKQIDRASPAFREQLLGRQYAEALLNSSYPNERLQRWEESVELAKNAAALSPEDGETQLWLGRFLLRASLSDRLAASTREAAAKDSAQAFQKAVELLPDSQEAWLAYIGYLATTKQNAQIADVVRQAQLALDDDAQPMVLAAGYELQNRWFDAERVYQQAVESNPENLALVRRMATFYLGDGYQRADKLEKATPLVNDLLRAAADKPELEYDVNVMWARRTAAKLLAQTGDYQKALDAERLIAANVQNGALNAEDTLTMAKILATRPEPASKLKSIKLFEAVKRDQQLTPLDQLTLGQLYFATSQWDSAKSEMRDLVSSHPSFVAARDAYIRMLLVHDEGRDLSDATDQLKNLQKYAPTETSTLELLVRIFSKMGRQREVAPVLRGMLSSEEARRDPAVVVRIAKLLADLDDLDNAETLFKAAASAAPRANLDYADFLGKHRSLDAALDLLDSIRGSNAEMEVPAIQYASALLKFRGEEVTDEQFERVTAWLDRSLREDPESIRLLMQQAELLDTRREYAESSRVYHELLERKDLAGFQRAVVLNNLAYQIALTTTDEAAMEEAIGYVSEAADILGPRSDILDTRAVVYMAMGRHEAAVADMELAVTDGPTASKYFHKSRAHLLAGDQIKAVNAWDKAVDMGLKPAELSQIEREKYQEVQSKIQRIKGQADSADAAS